MELDLSLDIFFAFVLMLDFVDVAVLLENLPSPQSIAVKTPLIIPSCHALGALRLQRG